MRDDEWFRRWLRRGRSVESSDATARWFGILARSRREGDLVNPEQISRWAAEEGWDERHATLLEGMALAVAHGMPDFGALRQTTAPDGSAVFHLTRDEAALVRSALVDAL